MADTKIREGEAAPDSPSNIEKGSEERAPQDKAAEFDRGNNSMEDILRGYKPGG